jgi:hypothetical protein
MIRDGLVSVSKQSQRLTWYDESRHTNALSSNLFAFQLVRLAKERMLQRIVGRIEQNCRIIRRSSWTAKHVCPN